MNNTEENKIKYWVDNWEKADIALKSIKKRELRSFDYNENLKIIDQMLQWAIEHQQIRYTSGLAEQQYYFKKLRNLTQEKDS